MKKVLLATTILAASAGFAAADVTVTGSARMGVTYDDSKADNELSFTNRVRIAFTASGETDGGLSFGATIRADNATGGNAGDAGSVFISGAFGTITMGDVDEAFGALFGDIAGVGLTGLGDLNELSHSADGGAFSLGAGTLGALGIPAAATAFGTNGIVNPLFAYNTNNTPNTADDFYTSDVATLTEFFNGLENAFVDFDAAAAIGAIDDAAALSSGEFVVGPNGAITIQNDALNNNSGLGQADSRFYSQALILAGFGVDVSDLALGGSAAAAVVSGFAADTGLNLLEEIDWDYTATMVAPGISARALYEYSMNGFSVALGYSQTGKNEAGSIALSYAVDNLTVSVGVAQAKWEGGFVRSLNASGFLATPIAAGPALLDGSAGTPAVTTGTYNVFTSVEDLKATDLNVGVRYAIDNLTLAAVYQDKDFKAGGVKIDQHRTVGVSASYKMDALGLTAFATETKSDLASQRAKAFGIGASYDLGGGASVVGGIVDSRGFSGPSKTTADLGVSFTF